MVTAAVLTHSSFWVTVLKWLFGGVGLYAVFLAWREEKRLAQLAQLRAEAESAPLPLPAASPADRGIDAEEDEKHARKCLREREEALQARSSALGPLGMGLSGLRAMAIVCVVGALASYAWEASLYDRDGLARRAAQACEAAPDVMDLKLEAAGRRASRREMAEAAFRGTEASQGGRDGGADFY